MSQRDEAYERLMAALQQAAYYGLEWHIAVREDLSRRWNLPPDTVAEHEQDRQANRAWHVIYEAMSAIRAVG